MTLLQEQVEEKDRELEQLKFDQASQEDLGLQNENLREEVEQLRLRLEEVEKDGGELETLKNTVYLEYLESYYNDNLV